ncbi:unnamed protein product, partial [Iphiclides podalirius]
MSDSEDEATNARTYQEIANEIERYKSNPETSGMFVSGWDDADQDVDIVKNPQENPIDHVLWAAENGELEILQRLLKDQPGLPGYQAEAQPNAVKTENTNGLRLLDQLRVRILEEHKRGKPQPIPYLQCGAHTYGLYEFSTAELIV